jgi:hypothetical protein
MAKFKKKPVVIDAIKADDILQVSQWADSFGDEIRWNIDGRGVHIPTLEGVMTANWGDWIIRGIAGEFYPCKPDIFAETYELVEP